LVRNEIGFEELSPRVLKKLINVTKLSTIGASWLGWQYLDCIIQEYSKIAIQLLEKRPRYKKYLFTCTEFCGKEIIEADQKGWYNPFDQVRYEYSENEDLWRHLPMERQCQCSLCLPAVSIFQKCL